MRTIDLKFTLRGVWNYISEIVFLCLALGGLYNMVIHTDLWNSVTYAIFSVLIVVSLLLMKQFIRYNVSVGWIIGVFSALCSLYMLLAVSSEFREIPIGSESGFDLLLVGLPLFILSLLLAIKMCIRCFNAR